jgi:hypothetical protein
MGCEFIYARRSLGQRQIFQISQLARQFIRLGSAQVRHHGTRHVFHVSWFKLVESIAIKPVYLRERSPPV